MNRIIIALFVYILITPSVFGEATITINGKTMHTSGNHVTVNNRTIVVDGKIISSSNMLKGSGKIASENRELDEFEAIRLDINANVTIVKGEKAKCVVTADDNILPIIATKQINKTLHIFAKESYLAQQKVKVDIETPLLKKTEINGSGTIAVTDALKGSASLMINGSGDIIAKGQVNKLMATINGSGDLHIAELEAKTATVNINGSGNADVHVTNSLTAKVNGSGDITYLGAPSEIHSSVKGSGNISKK